MVHHRVKYPKGVDMNDPVIVSAVRTPLGAFNGVFVETGATDLGGLVIAEAVRRAGIDPAEVNEVIMGQVLPCGYGQNPSKQAAVKAGMPVEAECLTINKVCGSGLKSVMLAAQAIRLGDADVVVAGGMENMSMAPYYLEKARFGLRKGSGQLVDSMVHDGLWDVVNDFHMGTSNEICCAKYNISRQAQDRFAALSYARTLDAMASGRFKEEILPVRVSRPKGATLLFDTDECPRPTSYDTLSRMKPIFQKDGVTTAGNASNISDGAAAVVVMSREKAQAMGCEVMVSIGAQASAGIEMQYVLVAPLRAVPKCLAKEGIDLADVDLVEVNEAFAGSSCAVIQELGLDPDKTNISGGCVALGHPIGASGCRILVTLIYNLIREDQHTGLATLCLGGGEAVAMVMKR
jgi:acetyl-CoA C-acetyltransferase